LSFGNKKIVDTSRKIWIIQRQEMFEQPIEAVSLTKSGELVVEKKTIDIDIIDEAELLIKKYGIASASFLQRKMKLGYARAARVMDALQEKGIVGPSNGAKPREIIK